MTIRHYKNLNDKFKDVLPAIATEYSEVKEMIRDFAGEFSYKDMSLKDINLFTQNLTDYLITKEAYEYCASLKKIKDYIEKI